MWGENTPYKMRMPTWGENTTQMRKDYPCKVIMPHAKMRIPMQEENAPYKMKIHPSEVKMFTRVSWECPARRTSHLVKFFIPWHLNACFLSDSYNFGIIFVNSQHYNQNKILKSKLACFLFVVISQKKSIFNDNTICEINYWRQICCWMGHIFSDQKETF